MQTRTLADLVRAAEKVGNAGADIWFKAADMPEADKTRVHPLAVLAAWERDQISTRTKAAETRAQSLKLAPGPASVMGPRPRSVEDRR